MSKSKLIYEDLSYEIIGVLFDVDNELGYGYQEKYFERAVASGLRKKGLQYSRQASIKIKFKNDNIGYYRLDFLIENKIILEIKTGKRFTKKDFDQVKAYLHATGLQLAIMAIFTNQGVRYFRVCNIDDKIEIDKTELDKKRIRKIIQKY